MINIKTLVLISEIETALNKILVEQDQQEINRLRKHIEWAQSEIVKLKEKELTLA